MVLVFINDVTPRNFEKAKMTVKMDKTKCGILNRTRAHSSSEGTSAEDSRVRRQTLIL